MYVFYIKGRTRYNHFQASSFPEGMLQWRTAKRQKYIPACATGLVFLVERNLLKRRIERMLKQNVFIKGKSIHMSLGLAIVVLMTGIAYASNGFVQDRRITMTEAMKLAAKAQQNSDFPVVLNEAVLKQLNRYIGTPEGRDFMRNALQRMEGYRSVIENKIKGYRLPDELLALPITESGYQNLSEGHNPHMKAAGIWQFIPATARNFGLRVDEQKDERLDITLSTDAALRYLQANQLRFGDWHLAVLAYNMGESAVQKGIDATASRNAWILIRNGYEGDKDYLPKLIAAILIMKNPESVE
jgi:membrane-bound lytic murein transglycosylase D